MLAPVLINAAAEPVLSLEEAKLACRIEADASDEDELVAAFVEAATAHLQDTLGMKLVSQEWRQDFAGFSACLRLPFRPVDPASIVVDYRDADDTVQVLDQASYYVLTDAEGTYLQLASGASWPSTFNRPDAVNVSFTAGLDPDAVPPALKAAVRLHVGHLYENRETIVVGSISSALPMGYDWLVWSFKRPGV